MPALVTLRESLRLLGSRRFGTFWFASLLSSIGTWAQQVAEPWLLLTLGASPFVIGLDTFAMSAPVWLLTLKGGALADRADRRRIITLFQSIQMLCPVGIVILLLTHRVQAWMIIAFSLVVGITDALSMPSFQSIVPSIVPREQIGQGIALNSTQFNLSRVLGPALAGALMSSVGAVACFVASALSYIPFIGVALWILPRKSVAQAPGAAPLKGDVSKGVREILAAQQLRWTLLSVLGTAIFCGPLITFAPVLVKQVFQGSAGHFSAAVASFGLGGLLGAVVLVSLPVSVDRRRFSAICALLEGVVLVLTALNPWIWALPLLLVLAGAFLTIANASANTLLQSTAAPHLLGRTVSLYMLALRGGISLGALMIGAAASVIGVREALLVSGAVAVVVQGVVMTRWLSSARA